MDGGSNDATMDPELGRRDECIATELADAMHEPIGDTASPASVDGDGPRDFRLHSLADNLERVTKRSSHVYVSNLLVCSTPDEAAALTDEVFRSFERGAARLFCLVSLHDDQSTSSIPVPTRIDHAGASSSNGTRRLTLVERMKLEAASQTSNTLTGSMCCSISATDPENCYTSRWDSLIGSRVRMAVLRISLPY
jgi:hypothetical protein